VGPDNRGIDGNRGPIVGEREGFLNYRFGRPLASEHRVDPSLELQPNHAATVVCNDLAQDVGSHGRIGLAANRSRAKA
jgi:hypothetical protein